MSKLCKQAIFMKETLDFKRYKWRRFSIAQCHSYALTKYKLTYADTNLIALWTWI